MSRSWSNGSNGPLLLRVSIKDMRRVKMDSCSSIDMGASWTNSRLFSIIEMDFPARSWTMGLKESFGS